MLYHVYTNAVADGTATSVVRPSDWNSGHKESRSLSGNTAGSAAVSGLDVVFVGGNGITLSADTAASKIVWSGSNQSVQTENMVSVLGSTGDISFANSNGVTFGGNASTITASHNGLTSQSNQAVSAANGSFTFQTATFANSNGVSFSTGTQGIFATVKTDYLTSQSNQAFNAGAVESNFQTLVFQDSNGVSFSNNAGSVRVTHGLQHTSATSAITSAALHTSASRVMNVVAATNNAGGGTASLSSNVSFTNANGATFYTSAGNAVALSYTVPAAQTGISGVQVSDATFTSGTVNFRNANGISFGSSGANGVSASYTVPTVTNSSWTVSDAASSASVARLAFTNLNGVTLSLSTGAGGSHTIVGSHNAITTARASNDAIGLNTAQSNVTWTVNSAGLSLDARGYAGTGTAITGNASITLNSGGLSFNGSNLAGVGTTFNGTNVSGTMTLNSAGLRLDLSAAAGGAGDGYNILAAGTQTANTTGTVKFENSNGITWGMSNSTQITASYSQSTHPHSLSLFAVGNTTQSSSGATDVANLSFQGNGIVSVGVSNGSVVMSATQSNQAFSAAGGSSAFQTLSFADTNGVSWTNTGGSVGATVRTDYASSIHGHTITAFATSNTTQSSSGTINMNSLIFAGAGIASVGVTNGSVVVSVPTGGGVGDGGVFAGVSNLGNTAGSTGTVSTGNLVLVGSRGITLSQSTAGAGSAATVTILGEPEMSVFRNYGQISAAGTAQVNSLASIQPFIIQHDLVFSNVMVPASFSVTTTGNNSSAFMDVSFSGVLYSRNVSTLSSIASFSNTMTQTWSSNATGTVTGVIGLTATLAAQTLQEGEYFWCFHISSTNSATGGAATTALGHTISPILAVSIGSAANLVKAWGAQTNNTIGLYPGMGMISTGATRASIAFSDYTVTGTRAFLAPVAFEMRNQTWQI